MRLCNRYQRRTCASSSASSLPSRRCIIASKKRAREVVRKTEKEIDPFSASFSFPPPHLDLETLRYVRKCASIVVHAGERLSLINSVYAKKRNEKAPFTGENVGN